MATVRRACAVAFIVGVTCWAVASVRAMHPPVRTLVSFGHGHGLVVSDLPSVVTWAVLVGCGLRALR